MEEEEEVEDEVLFVQLPLVFDFEEQRRAAGREGGTSRSWREIRPTSSDCRGVREDQEEVTEKGEGARGGERGGVEGARGARWSVCACGDSKQIFLTSFA